MPLYVYQCMDGSGTQFELFQKIHDPHLTVHPDTGVPVIRIIGTGIAIKTRGLKRSTMVNKRSPAATACGCASNAALAQHMYANSRKTPQYSPPKPQGTHNNTSYGHSHGHSHCSGHGHTD